MSAGCVCGATDGSPGLQVMSYGINQSGEVDEVCDGLSGAPLLHPGATDGIEGDSQDGAVQGQRGVHTDRLQASELGRRGDGCQLDVC